MSVSGTDYSIEAATGNIQLTFDGSGGLVVRFAQVRLELTANGADISARVNGEARWAYRANARTFLTTLVAALPVDATSASGEPLALPQEVAMSVLRVPPTASVFACNAGTLTVTDGAGGATRLAASVTYLRA